MNLVKALNEINANVWAVFILVLGAVLVSFDQKEVGATLITGSFAAFRSSASKPDEKPAA